MWCGDGMGVPWIFFRLMADKWALCVWIAGRSFFSEKAFLLRFKIYYRPNISINKMPNYF